MSRRASSIFESTGGPDVTRINSVSSRVSHRFGFDEENEDTVKAARITFRPYFFGNIPPGEIALKDLVNVRVLKTSPGAAIARWTKFKGEITLGSGRFGCHLKKGKKGKVIHWTFDVGMIKNIGYKRKGAKDFSLSFHDNDKLLNVVCSDTAQAERWLTGIFAEIRVQATVFGKILKETLNDTWLEVLKVGNITHHGEEIEVAAEKEKDLVMDDDLMNLAETCMREEVDLWTLCRGPDHEDVCEAIERLSMWLLRNFRREESAYWEKAGQKARANQIQRMKHEMNPAEATMKVIEDSALDELRNPSGMNSLNALSDQREQNQNVNVEKRKEIILETLNGAAKKSAETATPNHDPFEDML